MEKVINLVMRSILGTIAIYFVNAALEKAGISLGVGINAVTVLTSGILGFSGVSLLYAVAAFQFL